MIVDRGNQANTRGTDRGLDRTIVLVGTAGATVFLLILLFVLAGSGDRRILVDTITPLLVSVSGVIMLLAGRPNAAAHLLIGMLGIAVWAIIGGSGIANDPLIGLMTMAVAGTLLVREQQLAYTLIAAAAVGIAAFFTAIEEKTFAERSMRTLIALIAFATLAWLVLWLRRQATDRQDQLEAALESKDEFVATVSHELRTPLTTIMGIAHEMKDSIGDFSSDELLEFAALLAEESSDIAGIVDDLLVAARSDTGSLTLDPRSVSLAKELNAAAVGTYQFEVHGPADFSAQRVTADPGRTRQIIRNLLVNAQRYGGPNVRVVADISQGYGVIEVRDSGGPIPQQERDQIFEAYQRSTSTDATPGSVGLGLTVSRRLARLMDGDVVYEHDGTESIFRLLLPLAPPQTTEAAQAVA